MPLTPIDESRGDQSRTPHEDTGEPSVARQLWNRAKELLAGVPVGGSLLSQPRNDPDTSAIDSENDTVTDLPAQDQSFTAPSQNTPEYNRIEPVCIETETKLTISIPENSEATITSDVWERVER